MIGSVVVVVVVVVVIVVVVVVVVVVVKTGRYYLLELFQWIWLLVIPSKPLLLSVLPWNLLL